MRSSQEEPIITNINSLVHRYIPHASIDQLLLSNIDDLVLEQQGRLMIDDINEKDTVRVTLSTISSTQDTSYNNSINNQLMKICDHTSILIETIQQILNVETNIESDMFVKSEEYELYMQKCASEMMHIQVIMEDFIHSIHRNKKNPLLLSCLELMKAYTKYTKDSIDDTAYFLERGIPMLLRFLGFMSLRFSQVICRLQNTDSEQQSLSTA
jgi:hypothetical protein